DEVVATQRCAAFATVVCADVCAHQEIVVALESEHEEFVERDGSESLAGADLLLHLVVVAFGAREPMPHKRALQLLGGLDRLRPKAGGLRGDSRMDRESPLRQAPQRGSEFRQLLELITIGQQGRGQGSAGDDAAEIAMRKLSTRRPLPIPALIRG